MNILKSPQQILLEQAGIMPKFAEGGATQPEISAEDMLALLMAHGYEVPHYEVGGGVGGTNYVPEYDPTAVAQPVPYQGATHWARDKIANVIGDKPADRLFGTGTEGAKSEYELLQLLNPALLATESVDAMHNAARAAAEHEPLEAAKAYYGGLLSLVPTMHGAKKVAGPVLSKLKKLLP